MNGEKSDQDSKRGFLHSFATLLVIPTLLAIVLNGLGLIIDKILKNTSVMGFFSTVSTLGYIVYLFFLIHYYKKKDESETFFRAYKWGAIIIFGALPVLLFGGCLLLLVGVSMKNIF